MNHNLNPSQKELLRWLFRLVNIGFQHVQWLICTGRLKLQGNPKAVANCERSKCFDNEFGKGHRQSNKVNTIKNNSMNEQELKKDHLITRQMVSIDHYILRAPGRLYRTKGKSYPCGMFSGGYVFIDHASGYVSINNQVAINITETIKEKTTFEREAQNQRVGIKGYHTDNEIFNASKFMEELLKKQKKIRLSGSRASYQNGAAEHTINTLVTISRNMLMHTALRCPEDTFTTDI